MEILLNDESKRINGDIVWGGDEDHSPAVQFSVDIESDDEFPLVAKGWHNPASQKLNYTIIVRPVGRIYALDLGQEHRDSKGDRHKHYWTELRQARNTYVPEDITATSNQVIDAWNQFCTEAKLQHAGSMIYPAIPQMVLGL